MSASLVGSEMCIRDRLLLTHAAPADGCAQSQPALRVNGAREVACCSPVSYTHLTLPTICSV
eukprot:5249379-Alexandrium_andersonii.AAC.1